MKKIIILACLCSTLVACENVEKKAALKLAEARAAFEAGNYNEAKMQIDSIKILYTASKYFIPKPSTPAVRVST